MEPMPGDARKERRCATCSTSLGGKSVGKCSERHAAIRRGKTGEMQLSEEITAHASSLSMKAFVMLHPVVNTNACVTNKTEQLHLHMPGESRREVGVK